jgi:NIMA (never in mitosis gene a)-related kinase
MVTLQPPFTSADMNGLFRKVCKGQYKRISKTYSMDLSYMLKWLLQVKPENRPSCDQIIKMPIFLRRVEKIFPERLTQQEQNELMKTIKMPSNNSSYFLTQLSEKLPRPNYEPIQLEDSDDDNLEKTNLLCSRVSRDKKVNKNPLYKYSNSENKHMNSNYS